jgi:TPR repeat protein
MRITRFWIIQILIIASLFSILIGSYLFSFGWFANKPTLEQQAEFSPPASVALTEPTPALAPTRSATCSTAEGIPSLSDIEDSLGSHDTERQASCFSFLQAESMAGDKGAELWLGRAYHNGCGVAKNLAEAANHYQQAATADDAATRDSARQWLLQLQQEQRQP